jgi:urate oxidase
LPRCPNIAGIVFELLNYYATKMTVDAIAGELTRAGEVWRRDRRPSGAIQE